MIKNFIRWNKFKDRIEKELPGFHPNTGIKLYWNIRIYKKEIFNIKTGKPKQIGLGKLKIEQLHPSSLRDSNVYYFNWFNKQIVRNRLFRWG